MERLSRKWQMETKQQEGGFMKTLEITQRIALRKILFATDFSPYSNAALPYALAIAHQYGAKLFATHVMSSDSYLFAPPESWAALVDQAEPRLLDVGRLEE